MKVKLESPPPSPFFLDRHMYIYVLALVFTLENDVASREVIPLYLSKKRNRILFILFLQ